MDDKYQKKYRIASARAAWHDYGGGEYFVTVCTQDMICYFGEVGNGEMCLNELGEYLAENLRNVSIHYPYCEIPLFVVMPNHWHAIVVIDPNKTPYERRTHVQTQRAALPNKETQHATSVRSDIANLQGWASVVIGGLKSAVTRYAKANNLPFQWQTRFYDHIIRNQEEMNKIAEYIENNPIRWTIDQFHVKQ